MKALLVIPAFNEAATIKDLVTAAKAQIPNVLVIDDGSFDASGEFDQRHHIYAESNYSPFRHISKRAVSYRTKSRGERI